MLGCGGGDRAGGPACCARRRAGRDGLEPVPRQPAGHVAGRRGRRPVRASGAGLPRHDPRRLQHGRIRARRRRRRGQRRGLRRPGRDAQRLLAVREALLDLQRFHCRRRLAAERHHAGAEHVRQHGLRDQRHLQPVHPHAFEPDRAQRGDRRAALVGARGGPVHRRRRPPTHGHGRPRRVPLRGRERRRRVGDHQRHGDRLLALRRRELVHGDLRPGVGRARAGYERQRLRLRPAAPPAARSSL